MIVVIGIVKTIVAWFIIMLISVNLLGYVVRGLLWSPTSMEEKVAKIVFRDVPNREPMTPIYNFVITLVAFVLTATWFFALYHFWNIGLVAAAGLIMLSRLPDLLWEIKHGVKVTKNTGPKYGNLLCALEILLSFPLIWYSLCKWPQ
ncbi:MAG: hypothetical protein WC476_12345 [Phycisphaerae bacterium]|jgi:hypothetical protein